MRRSAVLVSLALGLTTLTPVVAAADPAAATVRYVSPTGDDSAAGTLEAPLRTPQVALDQLASGGTVLLLPGTYDGARIVVSNRRDLTIAATTDGAAVLDETGVTPPDGDSGVVQIHNSSDITVRGLDIRGYRTTSLDKIPIGIYVTGRGTRITLSHNHVHDLGNDNQTLGSYDINAHGIAVYGRSSAHPISRLTIADNEVDHLTLGASESVVVNGNVTHWRIVRNSIHDNNNIGIDAIGGEETIPGKPRYTRVNQARYGTIAGNTVSRIVSAGNPSYWQDGGWCNCADGIYVDSGSHIDIRDNVVQSSDIGIEIGAENPRGHSDHVRVRRNQVSDSGFVGLALGGYGPTRGEVYAVRVTNNRFRGNNTLQDGSPELLLQFHLHETTIVGNTIAATNRATPLLVQRERTVGPRRLNAHVRLDDNQYSAPVRAGRAEFVWRGRSITGFASYVARSGQDRRSHYHRAP